MLKNRAENNHLEWFKKADEDELSVKAIFKGKGAPSTVCFLSQQMAEKYLKGLLIFYKKSFPKVHDLNSFSKSFENQEFCNEKSKN